MDSQTSNKTSEVVGKVLGSAIYDLIVYVAKYFLVGLLLGLSWNAIVPLVAQGALDAHLINTINIGNFLSLGIYVNCGALGLFFISKWNNSSKK